MDQVLGTALPSGVDDVTPNEGGVRVGGDQDTADIGGRQSQARVVPHGARGVSQSRSVTHHVPMGVGVMAVAHEYGNVRSNHGRMMPGCK